MKEKLQQLFFDCLKSSIVISFAGVVVYLLLLAANNIFNKSAFS